MPITLRPYQSSALAEIQTRYREGVRNVLLVAPTGAGKSAMLGYMLGRTQKRTLILCHRSELLEMISDSLPVPHAIIGGSTVARHAQVQVGMMQTVARRLDKLPPFDWVISDEAHLAFCPTWLSILRHYGTAWHLGMSATPCRLDGQGLGQHYQTIVYGPTIRELTDRGFLAPCRVFAPDVPADAIKKSGSDYNMEAAAHALDRPSITGNAVAHLRRLGPGRRAIAFCCNRVHADHVAEEFRNAGIAAVNVDGAMTPSERLQRVGAFRRGDIQVLTNVDLLTTGFDCPQIEVGIFLRPTQSLALYLQMIGRILRMSPGKTDAILLDHVGNVLRHGMPDEVRQWTLEGREKRSTVAAVKQCDRCYAVFSPAPKCPACGTVLAVAAKSGTLKSREGELVEFTSHDPAHRLKTAPLKELLKTAHTKEALEAIGRARGYQRGWVQMTLAMKARSRSRWRGGQAA